jgi:hypothetical protein
MRADVDRWASQQSDEPGRSEAIRRLVEIGLEAAPQARRGARSRGANAKRALELAAKTIDGVVPAGTPAEERKVRKRKILEGPSDVREVRQDNYRGRSR